METRACGGSGLKLPVLGIGCWQFGGGDYWGPADQAEVDAIVRRAVELGANYFDNAEVYNGGRSEESLGLALRGIRREDVIIGTKISPHHLQPDQIPRRLEQSLKRLGTDYADIYMIHWPPSAKSIAHYTAEKVETPAEDKAFAVLRKLRDEGKIRHIGVSNYSRPRIEKAIAWGVTPSVNELPYNLLARAIESETLPFCARSGIGVIGYFALMQGILSDRWRTLGEVPAYQRRTRHFDTRDCKLYCTRDGGAEAETQAALDAVRAVAKDLGINTATLALKWAVANRDIACVLVGTKNAKRVEDNVHAAAEPLPAEAVDRLNQATEALKQRLGPSFDYYQSCENDRTV